jgi:hypothetical protein
MTTQTMKKIPGYGDKYRLCKDGRVFRRAADGRFVEVAQSGDPPRVRLSNGAKKYTRKYVHLLLDEVFGE